MTTTPDSRIRADWTLPAETAAPPPAVAPDTSTTAGKVRVMEHVASGGQMQMMTRGRGGTLEDDGWSESWTPPSNYNFNWERYDYRIAPPTAPRTALQAAREYTMTAPDKVNASSMARLLVALLQEIDSSPLVIISMRTVGFGDEATPYPTIVQLVDGDPKSMKPGRYRLVRDDQ